MVLAFIIVILISLSNYIYVSDISVEAKTKYSVFLAVCIGIWVASVIFG